MLLKTYLLDDVLGPVRNAFLKYRFLIGRCGFTVPDQGTKCHRCRSTDENKV